MSQQPVITYEASVYERTVQYTNFRGKSQKATLYFALDPIALMAVIASFEPKKSKSKNPARAGQTESITDEEQIRFVRTLAAKSAGFPSDDGELWEPFEDFENSLAGKAFLTKLVSSDEDRKEFSEKVILDPFRAFVKFALADSSNSSKEMEQFQKMLSQLENIFTGPKPEDETIEDRRARLAAEIAALDDQKVVPGTVVES